MGVQGIVIARKIPCSVIQNSRWIVGSWKFLSLCGLGLLPCSLARFRFACAAAITVLVITNLPFSQPLTFLTFFAYLWKFLAMHLLYICHLLSYTSFLFQNLSIKVNLNNTVEPQLTATSLQRPLFVVDSPYIDSCLNFSKMATFFGQSLANQLRNWQATPTIS